MEKIKLISPKMYKEASWEGGEKVTHPPVGLTYIASVLENNGYDVEIFDLELTEEKKVLNDLDSALAVGVTIRDPTIYSGKKICEKVKEECPETKIIVGGNTPTTKPELFLKEDFVDFIVRGEGEYANLDIINSLTGNKEYSKNGKIERRKGKIIYNSYLIDNIDSLPLPAFHLAPPSDYDIGGISTSRGCGHNCNFCSIKPIFKRYRERNEKKVVDELKIINKKYKVNHVNFTDENFMQNPKRVDKLSDLIIKNGLNKNCTFEVEARVDDISENPKTIKKMSKAGFSHIFMGGESGSISTLDFYRKGIRPEQTLKSIEICKENEIIPKVSFTLCSPRDSKSDIIKNIDMAIKCVERDASVRFTPFITPYYGTQIYDYIEEKKELDFINERPDWKHKNPEIRDALLSYDKKENIKKSLDKIRSNLL